MNYISSTCFAANVKRYALKLVTDKHLSSLKRDTNPHSDISGLHVTMELIFLFDIIVISLFGHKFISHSLG